METMIDVSGEYPVGDYTVKTVYGAYSANAPINMAGNQNVTLTLEGFEIPEISPLVILPSLVSTTPIATIVYKKRARANG